MKKIILEKLSGGNFVSGADIAETLGVSRTAVWKAVNKLRKDGFAIDAVRSQGYQISPDNNKLAPELIGRDVIILDEINSTNDYAKRLASEGAENGTAVLAEYQSDGKGRLDRTFVSPRSKGIYMSVILRPDFDVKYAPLITSAAAVAAAQAIEQLAECSVQIKWVNDIYLNDRKICGILTEASLGLEYSALDYAVVGIGINVFPHDFGELSSHVTAIQQETGKKISRNMLCRLILDNLERIVPCIPEKKHLGEYRRREMLTGKNISANVGNEQITGKALGIDDNANLIVQTDKGIMTLVSGEANIIRVNNTV